MKPELDSRLTEIRSTLLVDREAYVAAVAKIDGLLHAMGEFDGANHGEAVVTHPRRRGMSAAARKAASRRMKAYWAAKRKGK